MVLMQVQDGEDLGDQLMWNAIKICWGVTISGPKVQGDSSNPLGSANGVVKRLMLELEHGIKNIRPSAPRGQ